MIKYTTAKEFAEGYIGRKIKVNAIACPIKHDTNPESAEIIGYNLFGSPRVLVSFDDNSLNIGNSIYYNYFFIKDINRLTTHYWSVDIRDIITGCDNKPIIAYPNKCNRCGSSARKICRAILCSNIKCKSKQFKKIYNSKNIVNLPAVDKDNYILCPSLQRTWG